MVSPSSRAEWVEMEDPQYDKKEQVSPSSRAEWVEIVIDLNEGEKANSLRPRGRSGLKLVDLLFGQTR